MSGGGDRGAETHLMFALSPAERTCVILQGLTVSPSSFLIISYLVIGQTGVVIFSQQA